MSIVIAINIHTAIVSARIEKKMLLKHGSKIILELILTHCVNRKKGDSTVSASQLKKIELQFD